MEQAGEEVRGPVLYFSPIIHGGSTFRFVGTACVSIVNGEVTPQHLREITFQPRKMPVVSRVVDSRLVISISMDTHGTDVAAAKEEAAQKLRDKEAMILTLVQPADLSKMAAGLQLTAGDSVLDARSCWENTDLAHILTPEKPPSPRLTTAQLITSPRSLSLAQEQAPVRVRTPILALLDFNTCRLSLGPEDRQSLWTNMSMKKHRLINERYRIDQE